MAEVPSPCAMRCRFGFSVVGIVVGVMIFLSFGFSFNNWNCAAWGLASGLLAALTLGVHIEYRRFEWKRQPRLLTSIMLCGCFMQLGALIAFSVYLALAIEKKHGLTADGFYVTCVWCLMTWKWAFLLFFYSRSYRRIVLPTEGLDISNIPYQKI